MNAQSFLTHLECAWTGAKHDAGRLQNLSEAGKPLLARYDLEKARGTLDRDAIAARGGGFWKWRELLPVQSAENVIALGEIDTPNVGLCRTAAWAGATGPLIVKDEGRLPTGSFKARGLALAVARAKELGATFLAMPTNGNAGAALAAYASRAGLPSICFCPADTPEVNVREIALQGAEVWRVNGYITDCGKIVGAGKEEAGWFDVSTLKEPYRIEGKKTMGYELAAQFGWTLPDAIVYPTGGGTGLIGMWKAFDEMERLGWIGSERPRMIAVQAKGCAPIVDAYEAGAETAEICENAHTIASGIRVPGAIGDFLILRAVRESGGFAIAVSDEEIEEARRICAARDGLLLCPEGAATLAAARNAVRDGRLAADARTILFNCGSGLKYPMPDMGELLPENTPIDYSAMARRAGAG